jgi:hypothetical protein
MSTTGMNDLNHFIYANAGSVVDKASDCKKIVLDGKQIEKISQEAVNNIPKELLDIRYLQNYLYYLQSKQLAG